MTNDRITEAARLLAEAWCAGRFIDPLPDRLRPRDVAEATAVQDAMIRFIGLPVAGWKVAGSPGPLLGRILAPRVFASPAVLPQPAFAAPRIECELGFRLLRDLPPRPRAYKAEEVAEACQLITCLEITATRIAGGRHSADDAPMYIADNGMQGGLVMGARIDDWRNLSLLDIAVDLRIAGGPSQPLTPRVGRNDPFDVMVWLANALSERGLGLSAGQAATLGSVTLSQPLAPGQTAVADYGRFGAIEVHVAKSAV